MNNEKVISIFDSHKEAVLTFPVHIRGKKDQLYVLRELMVENDGPADPDMLSKRLRELPAVLAFFGTMLDNSEAQVAKVTEDFDTWYATASDAVVEKYNKDLQASSLPASLKKPLTIDALKGKVMLAYSNEWMVRKEELNAVKERTSLLCRMVESINAAIRLIPKETDLMTMMMSSGIAESRSNQNSRLNGFMKPQPKS